MSVNTGCKAVRVVVPSKALFAICRQVRIDIVGGAVEPCEALVGSGDVVAEGDETRVRRKVRWWRAANAQWLFPKRLHPIVCRRERSSRYVQ